MASAPQPSKPREDLTYEWYVVAALTALYTLSYVDRTILGLLVGPIKRDLGVNDTEVGLLTGVAFSVFYTFMGLPIGRLADTKNRRNLIAAGLVVWSFFTSAGAATRSYATLFLARIGVGVGESSLSPAAYSVISDYFPKRLLGVAISVFYMGVFVGSSLALFLGGMVVQALTRTPTLTLPLLGTIASWRATFLLVGLPGFLFVLLVYTIREPRRRDLIQSSAGGTDLPLGETIAQMRLRSASLIGISAAGVFQSMCTYALISWGPQFFQRIHGWNAAEAGRSLAGILLVFGCGGMFFGGKIERLLAEAGIAGKSVDRGCNCRNRLGFVPGAGVCGERRSPYAGSGRARAFLCSHAHGHFRCRAAADLSQSGARSGVGFLSVRSQPGRLSAGHDDTGCIKQLLLSRREDARAVPCDYNLDRRGIDADSVCRHDSALQAAFSIDGRV